MFVKKHANTIYDKNSAYQIFKNVALKTLSHIQTFK